MGLRRLWISATTADPLERATKLADLGDGSIAAIIHAAGVASNNNIVAMGQAARRERATTPRFDYGDFANLLAKLDRQRVMSELLKQFRSEKTHLNALNLLVRLNEPLCVDPMIDDLGGRWRGSAISVLGAVADRRAVDPLIRLLGSTDRVYEREDICKALGAIGDRRAVPALIDALQRSHEPRRDDQLLWTIRQAAAEALGKIGDRAAVAPLIEACHWPEPPLDQRNAGASEFARFHAAAIRALERLGDPAAVPVLIDTLWREGQKYPIGEPLLRDSRRCAAAALGKLGDTSAIEPLLKAAANRFMHKQTIDALAQFDDSRARETVAAAARDRETCFICGRSGGKALLPRASADQKQRAGGDAVVASMLAFVEGIESGTAGTSTCINCGRWACTACIDSNATFVDCPSCDLPIRR